jgi:hypothetical protein
MGLTEFLAARLDDEQRNASEAFLQWPDTHFLIQPGSLVVTQFHRTHDPARVLREVEAKRKILAQQPEHDRGRRNDVLRALAAVYEDHEDYDPAWKE